MPSVQAPVLLVQALVAATGSARETASILHIGRATVHKLRDGDTRIADATAKRITREYNDWAKAHPTGRKEVGAAQSALSRFKTENRPEQVRKWSDRGPGLEQRRADFDKRIQKERSAFDAGRKRHRRGTKGAKEWWARYHKG